MPEMKILLESYVDDFDHSDLLVARPHQNTRRACILALARDLLVKKLFFSLEEAKQVTIERYSSGEPYLKVPGREDSGLHISISHSGLWMACLISTGGKSAGIDMEDLSLKRNFLNLARHFFSYEEYEYVKELGVLAFYKLWTAKEAIAKLRGKGLSEVLRIKLSPGEVEAGHVSLEGCGYDLVRHATEAYIYTIARSPY
jgi:4'-phosphopantetheinyl transferase